MYRSVWWCVAFLCHISVAKVFERCELARLLRDQHGLSLDETATWVCIAQHQSNLNSSAYAGHLDNGAHGLFQISDMFWCSPPGKGWACGVACDKLRDDDLTDDMACVRTIYEEHQRISGDGYNAWASYQHFCRGKSEPYVHGCFDEWNSIEEPREYRIFDNDLSTTTEIRKQARIYDRCELAQELRYTHKIPMEQIANWVCIAHHESNYNTSAVGRLNADGSGDHGIFQISDIYWCSPPGNGWVCGLSCSQLEDNDITDDVRCMQTIYEEHQRISGDGFNAWTVYQPYCYQQSEDYIHGCFSDLDDNSIGPLVASSTTNSAQEELPVDIRKSPPKIYSPCELAQELREKHGIPEDQIATWVCIAQHESQFNTSAVGHVNPDGSGDHGIFQISDLFWCSPPGDGYACGVTCAELEDDDITDDVRCIKKIYDEHKRLSGDGFKAWTVYDIFCRGEVERYIENCENVIPDVVQEIPSSEFSEPPPPPPIIPAITAPPKVPVYYEKTYVQPASDATEKFTTTSTTTERSTSTYAYVAPTKSTTKYKFSFTFPTTQSPTTKTTRTSSYSYPSYQQDTTFGARKQQKIVTTTRRPTTTRTPTTTRPTTRTTRISYYTSPPTQRYEYSRPITTTTRRPTATTTRRPITTTKKPTTRKPITTLKPSTKYYDSYKHFTTTPKPSTKSYDSYKYYTTTTPRSTTTTTRRTTTTTRRPITTTKRNYYTTTYQSYSSPASKAPRSVFDIYFDLFKIPKPDPTLNAKGVSKQEFTTKSTTKYQPFWVTTTPTPRTTSRTTTSWRTTRNPTTTTRRSITTTTRRPTTTSSWRTTTPRSTTNTPSRSPFSFSSFRFGTAADHAISQRQTSRDTRSAFDEWFNRFKH